MSENQIQILSKSDLTIQLLNKDFVIKAEKLFTPEGMSCMIDEINKQVGDFSADISTKQGRKEIISMAALVAKCKSPIKDLSMKFKEDSRKFIDSVNQQYNRYESAMDELRDKIRKPVDDIEEAEAKILKQRQDRLKDIEEFKYYMGNGDFINHSQGLKSAIDQVGKLLEFEWGEFSFKAETTVEEVISILQLRLNQAIKQEEQDLEIAQLKKEKAEREQKDHEAAIAAEAARKAKFTAEMEAAKKAKSIREAAEVEQKRIEAEKLKAEDDKRVAEQAKIDAENRAIEAEKLAKEQSEIAEIKRIAAEKMAKQDAEKAAKEAIEKERLRVTEEKRKKDEASARREANRKHCAKINNEALDAICGHIDGMTGKDSSKVAKELKPLEWHIAKIIVEMIAQGRIPHIQINY